MNTHLLIYNCLCLQVLNGYLSLLAHENPGQVFPVSSHIALKWAAKTGHEWMFETVSN